MPLDEGVYRLLYCPDGRPPGVGGVIAVGQEINTPVRALPADLPGEVGFKHWVVHRAPNDPSLPAPEYIINTRERFAGWGRNEDYPGEDVLFTTISKHWNIEPQGDEFPNVHVISVPTKEVGAIWAVVVEDDRLVIRGFPVVPGAPPTPAWQFEFIAPE